MGKEGEHDLKKNGLYLSRVLHLDFDTGLDLGKLIGFSFPSLPSTKLSLSVSVVYWLMCFFSWASQPFPIPAIDTALWPEQELNLKVTMGICWIWVLLLHCIWFQMILISTMSYSHGSVYLLDILLVYFVTLWVEISREDVLWLKEKAAETYYFYHQCRKDCRSCIPAKMAGLQEQTLPSSGALPQVRLTMELMGHGQWERGNMNSCFMYCTMLSPASAGFS